MVDGKASVVLSSTPGVNSKKSFAIRLVMNGQSIGGIQELRITQNREITRVRHLNINDAGKVIDMAPGLVTGSLTATRVAINTYLLDTLFPDIDAATNLENLPKGFDIEVYEKQFDEDPVGNLINSFTNCWISSVSRSISVTGNILIVENANIEYQDHSGSATPVGTSEAQSSAQA